MEGRKRTALFASIEYVQSLTAVSTTHTLRGYTLIFSYVSQSPLLDGVKVCHHRIGQHWLELAPAVTRYLIQDVLTNTKTVHAAKH